MARTPHQHVVDATWPDQRHVAGRDQRVRRREGVPGLAGVRGLPGVVVGHAHALQGLAPGEEPDAGGVGRRVEVPEEHGVSRGFRQHPLDELRGRDRLEFALPFEVQLVARLVVGDDERPEPGRVELGDHRAAPRELPGARGDVEIQPVHPREGPAAREHGGAAVVGDRGVRGEVVAGHQIGHLVAHDLLQRHHVRVEPSQLRADRLAASRPVGVLRGQGVEGDDPDPGRGAGRAHQAHAARSPAPRSARLSPAPFGPAVVQPGPNAPPSTRTSTPSAISTTGSRTWPHPDTARATKGRVARKRPAAHHTPTSSRNTTA